MSTDICSNLPSSIKGTCELIANTPLTITMIYQLIQMIEPQISILTKGAEDIIKKNTLRIIIQNIIAQQLPWFIGFFLIIFTLLLTNVISIFTFIILLIATTVITIIIIGLNIYSSINHIEKTFTELKSQLKSNLDAFKNK